MARLGDAHIEQAKVLRAEGKSIREIVETLEKTYHIKTYAAAVTKACAGTKAGPASAFEKKAKRAYRKSGPKDTDEVSIGRLLKDIQGLLREIPEAYQGIIKHIRADLIKSRNEVYLMRTGAGIDIPESPIK